MIDQDPLPISGDRVPKVFYDPEGVLGLIYTSDNRQPKGVIVTHGNVLADVHNFNYWMRYTEGGIYLRGSDLPHRGFSQHVRGPGIRRQPNHNSEIQRADFLRDGRTRRWSPRRCPQ